MAAPYPALAEPLSQKSAPTSGRYNRKALALVALLSCVVGVALWTQLAGGEQQPSIDMISGLTQPVIGARPPSMPTSWRPMQSANVPQFMSPTQLQGTSIQYNLRTQPRREQ